MTEDALDRLLESLNNHNSVPASDLFKTLTLALNKCEFNFDYLRTFTTADLDKETVKYLC
eukprot:CAMPEP_0116912296 /NCGR_PEP_ID=MMETSP0467-20121206/15997_1 /TAXON_ID=283647 /ORGANISM="Mesodinium pulex, Strain SPMC105" /LENGTH=59 /DNA_ID=CAMNT_0004588239 /DNA_START=259 /DNA_END=438 /DNA_ORIENTATION=+